MKEIQLTQGFVALVDDEDYERVNQFKWHIKNSSRNPKNQYAERSFVENGKYKAQFMHRLILGNIPESMIIDHKNHIGYDNRKENLRTCTHVENQRNSTSHNSKYSIYKGVYYEHKLRKFKTSVKVNGKTKHIGVYTYELDAAKAYDEAVKIHYGEFANPNFK